MIYEHMETPTILLSTKAHVHLGRIRNIDENTINITQNLASAQEISFDVYRIMDNIEDPLWDSIVSFKYIFVPEYNTYFNIEVTSDDGASVVKHVTGTSACEFELSGRRLYNFECNTEADYAAQEYEYRQEHGEHAVMPEYHKTLFYNPENPEYSLLHRVLKDKCSDYSIQYVDDSLRDMFLIFSANGTDVYSFLTGTVAKEVECLFEFNSVTRTISVYDLKVVCNSCGHRGDMAATCPECGSGDYHARLGVQTNIFISEENYADMITCSGNTDNVFNCLQLSGGDDVITQALMYVNPNGTQYVYNFSQPMLEDMPSELVSKIAEYNTLYQSKQPEYQEKSEDYYNALDEYYRLHDNMMPVITRPTTTATAEAAALPNKFRDFGDIAVIGINSINTKTGNSAVKGIAEILVDPRYDVVPEGTIADVSGGKRWTGNIKVTNQGNEDDEAVTSTFQVMIVDASDKSSEAYVEYLNQKIRKRMDRNDIAFTQLWELESDTDFKNLLKEYCYTSLSSFNDGYAAALNVMAENGVGDKENLPEELAHLYNVLYKPTSDRQSWIADEMKVRGNECVVYDPDEKKYPNNVTNTLRKEINAIHDTLNFKKFVGNTLWDIFCHYRMESEYSNPNYVSDGMNNAEVLERAKELFDVGLKEVTKASEIQYTLTASMNNLLKLKEFKDYVDQIQLGNWITMKSDEELFYLRMIGASIDFGSPDQITVSFSDAVKVNNAVSDVESLLAKATAMASSYDTVMHQSDQGSKANVNVNDWLKNGLDNALVRIMSNDREEITYDNNGIFARAYDDITDSYSPEQLRITHNCMIFTNDNWLTARAAFGKHTYTAYNPIIDCKDSSFEDYGLSAQFVMAGYITGSELMGGKIYSLNYQKGGIVQGRNAQGTMIDLNDGTFTMAAGLLSGSIVNNKYKLSVIGDITANSLTLGQGVTIPESNIPAFQSYAKTEYVDNEIDGAKTELNTSIVQTSEQIRSSASKSVSKYDESVFETSTKQITMYGYGAPNVAPNSTYYPPNKHSGKYYLDQNSGFVWYSNGSTWSKARTDALPLITSELSSSITQTAESILSTVSATYQTQAAMGAYSTTIQMNSAIKQSADNITSTVEKTYQTKDAMGNYSTTTQMNTAISQSASSIEQSVSATYQTKSGMSTYTKKAEIILNINNEQQSSATINADKINLNGAITANNNVKIGTDGKITAVNADITGKITATSGEFSGSLKAATGTFTGSISSVASSYNTAIVTAKNTDSSNITRQSQVRPQCVYVHTTETGAWSQLFAGSISLYSGSSTNRTLNINTDRIETTWGTRTFEDLSTAIYSRSSGKNQVYSITKYVDSMNLYTTYKGGSGTEGANITLWTSDERLKKNIKKTSINALEKINEIGLYSYDWKDNTRGSHEKIGVVAQQLRDVIPEAVMEVEQPDGCEYDSLLQIDDNKITPYLIKAVQELSAEVKELKSQLKEARHD